jgi:hypothetical protein
MFALEMDGYGADSGPSRGDPCRRAIRPKLSPSTEFLTLIQTQQPLCRILKIKHFLAKQPNMFYVCSHDE